MTIHVTPSSRRSRLLLPLPWHPAEQQVREPDTTFLFDPAVEETLAPAEGGFLGGDGFVTAHPPWLGGTTTSVEDGKFLQGIQSQHAGDGFIWCPLAGLIGDRFTLEFQVWAEDFAAIANSEVPLALLMAGGDEGLRFQWYEGILKCQAIQYQTAESGALLLVADTAFTDDQFNSVAVTFDAGTLRLYVNEVLVDDAPFTAPHSWIEENGVRNGLCIGGSPGCGAQSQIVSDVRLSALPRIPGVRPGRFAPTVTIDSTDELRPINQRLLGGLTGFQTQAVGAYDPDAIAARTHAAGVVNVLRVDKFLTGTPIKAGGTDSTHPHLGHSGAYSYNWGIVDNTLDNLAATDAQPYISLNGCPQILGGSIAPFNQGNIDAGYLANYALDAPQVPNDLAAFATMCADLIYYITVTKGVSVPYVGLWNEPEQNGYFSGDEDDYADIYALAMPAVKAIDPTIKVGGPETGIGSWTWLQTLLDRVVADDLPLDFVSYHDYTGRAASTASAVRVIQDAIDDAGFTGDVEFINGEYSASSPYHFHNPAGGLPYWRDLYYPINDYAGANLAAMLGTMQAHGFARAIFTQPDSELGEVDYGSSGLFCSDGAWATGSVFRLWSQLLDTEVTATVSDAPGVSATASIGDGAIAVLLSRLSYKPGDDMNVTVDLGGHNGKAVTVTYLDADHGSLLEAESDTLTATSAEAVSGGRVTVTLPHRSVCLLEIAA